MSERLHSFLNAVASIAIAATVVSTAKSQDTLNVNVSGTESVYHHDDPEKIKLLKEKIENDKKTAQANSYLEAIRLDEEHRKNLIKEKEDRIQNWQKWADSIRQKSDE